MFDHYLGGNTSVSDIQLDIGTAAVGRRSKAECGRSAADHSIMVKHDLGCIIVYTPVSLVLIMIRKQRK